MLSFFALQRFQEPGRVMAWNPYKLLIEIGIAMVINLAIKNSVRKQLLGRFTHAFLLSMLTGFACLDVALWASIFVLYADMYIYPWDDDHIWRILDIAVGAGLLNFLLSGIATCFSIHLISVYLYEPLVRRRYVATFCLVSPEDLAEFEERLSEYTEAPQQQVKHEPTVYGQRVHLVSLKHWRPSHEEGGGEDEQAEARDEEGREEKRPDEEEGCDEASQVCGPVFVEMWRPGVSKS